MRTHHLSAGLLATAMCVNAACSDGKCDGAEALFEAPQILPSQAPVCLDRVDTVVGSVRTHPVLLSNYGKNALEIANAEIVDDLRGTFELQGIEPNRLASLEEAVAQVAYRPTEPGWDYAVLQVRSNAENYPTLRVAILARAVPANLDGGVYDPGEKPAESRGADGIAACEPRDAGAADGGGSLVQRCE